MPLTELGETEPMAADDATSPASGQLFARGRFLIVAVAAAFATLKVLLVYAMAWQGTFGDHYVVVMLALALVLVVYYQLAQGRAWARWTVVVILALSTVMAIARAVSPPEGAAASARWIAIGSSIVLCVVLYILAFSDAAAEYFRNARRPSSNA
jgi:hypothetical protein